MKNLVLLPREQRQFSKPEIQERDRRPVSDDMSRESWRGSRHLHPEFGDSVIDSLKQPRLFGGRHQHPRLTTAHRYFLHISKKRRQAVKVPLGVGIELMIVA